MLLFDIGANEGLWSIANQKDNTIIAVEASPNTYSKLCENVKEYSNIIPVHGAVCDSAKETVVFYDAICSGISTLNIDWLEDPKSRFYNVPNAAYTEIQVPTLKIDDLIVKFGTPNYIKIDVEGAEDVVLISLTKKISMIAFEWAAETREVAFKAIEHLERLGYERFAVQLNDDTYTYIPDTFPYNKFSIKKVLNASIDKIDWGMIFAI
jgi:FkbM family methyltransferase